MTSSNRAEQLRLFVAVTLPAEARDVLAGVIARLRAAELRGVRTVAPEGVHITLKFLGNVDAVRVPALSDALDAAAAAAAPFALALEGVGAFPAAGAPRVLWAGVTGETEALAALARHVDEECSGLGFPRERRAFSPHLTIARLRDTATVEDRRQAAEALTAVGLERSDGFRVDEVHLIKSTLTPLGAVYESMHTTRLAGRGS
ncbi:MAG: RNA 2',3'-cyclic phosphodiesterase [Chloroflexota bacterium]|nr:RNA 2',3'-cyclic phosphodiesterase [Chloroflexota bacterium]